MPRTVVIAEPDTDLLFVMAEIFSRKTRVEVLKVSTMAQACRTIFIRSPDAVITNDSLEDGSGCDLCRRFRQNGWRAASAHDM